MALSAPRHGSVRKTLDIRSYIEEGRVCGVDPGTQPPERVRVFTSSRRAGRVYELSLVVQDGDDGGAVAALRPHLPRPALLSSTQPSLPQACGRLEDELTLPCESRPKQQPC